MEIIDVRKTRCTSRSIILKIIAPVIALIIWVLSSQSKVPLPEGVFGIDKFSHFIAYAALAASFIFWFSTEDLEKHPLRSIVIAFSLSTAYGVIDEIHQFHVPGRSASVYDWAADLIGGIAGMIIMKRYTSLINCLVEE
jgi:VanZ family protein